MAYKFKVPGKPTIVYIKDGTVLPIDDDIVSKAETSMFGDYTRKMDVLDPSYRSSLEIKAEHLFFKVDDEYRRVIPNEFSRALERVKPNCTLQLYKLNIYREGDFFKLHVDTPKSEHYVGTLLWGLTDEYQGGELEVNHRERFVIGKNDCVYLDGHLPHQVFPVTSGLRLVVAFDVFQVSTAQKEEEEEDEYREDWEDLIRERRRIRDQQYVAIMLSMTYVKGGPGNEVYITNPNKLRGWDGYLYQKFKDAEFCEVVEYIDSMDYEDSDGSNHWITEDDARTKYVTKSNTYVIGEMTVHESEQGGEYYTGNSYCDSYTYSGALALVVRTEDFMRVA